MLVGPHRKWRINLYKLKPWLVEFGKEVVNQHVNKLEKAQKDTIIPDFYWSSVHMQCYESLEHTHTPTHEWLIEYKGKIGFPPSERHNGHISAVVGNDVRGPRQFLG